MKPGRQLDTLIAEKVMGWTPVYGDRPDLPPVWFRGDLDAGQLPRFSTNIGDAMFVWARMRQIGCCLILNEDVEVPAWSVTVKGPRWRPGLQTDEHKVLAFVETDVSMAYSICMAALKLFEENK
jgi:hypothetical protein